MLDWLIQYNIDFIEHMVFFEEYKGLSATNRFVEYTEDALAQLY